MNNNYMVTKNLKWVVALACAAGCLTSCGSKEPEQEKTSFETLTVKKQDITIPLKFSARLRGKSDVTITPQASGQLMRIAVSEGQQVKKGEVLFVIDSRNAQLELEAAQANLQAALAQENSAKLEFESNKNLFEKKIVSNYMLANSENAYKQAQAAVAQARAAVNRAKVELGFCTITAPVTGVIGEIPVRVGDQVSPLSELTLLSGNTTIDAEFSRTYGREWDVAHVGRSKSRSVSVDGVVLDSDSGDAGRFSELIDARFAWFRDGAGHVWRVGVSETSEERTPFGWSSVSVECKVVDHGRLG